MPSIEHFLSGFRRFQQHYYLDNDSLFTDLKRGQHPSTLLVGCCDSRVDPLMLTGCEPGELFIVRNVANLVPPCQEDSHYHGVSAALEYAVISLQVERIIVLGHASCGGIRALMEGITDHQEDGGFLAKWLSIADPAREFVLVHHANDNVATQLAVAERVSILVSLDNLMSFPWVRNRVETGKLQLLGWYFDIQEGALYGFDAHSKRFTPLVCPLGAV